ncbi:hypothetical protein S245_059403, partial [Arachis hypogaea]
VHCVAFSSVVNGRAPPSTTCGHQPTTIARFRLPQSFHSVNALTSVLIVVLPSSAAATSCHPGAMNKGVLLLTKVALLRMHGAVGSAIEASLLSSDERNRTSSAPASKPHLTELI